MKSPLVHITCTLAAMLAAGCSNVAPSPLNYSRARFDSCSKDTAFDAAVKAMSERYRIASSNRESGTIIAEPVESEGTAPGTRLGDIVQAPRRTRARGKAVVTGTASSAEVWCKIVIDRYDEHGAELFVHDSARLDDPTGTPADRGGARTPEQNAVWRTAGRDMAQERSILRAVAEFIERGPMNRGEGVTDR